MFQKSSVIGGCSGRFDSTLLKCTSKCKKNVAKMRAR
jgi:hypothetical protein